jgi:branched-chain amino acid transport system substrate-binding protein
MTERQRNHRRAWWRGLGLAVAVVTVLAACGDDDDTGTAATTAASSAATTAAAAATTAGGTATTAAAASTTAAGATTTVAKAPSGQPVKIGVILPLSGALAAAGRDYKLVIDNISKEPGHDAIDGRPVQIVPRDSQSTAAGATAAARQLLDEDKVDVIIGPLYTVEASAVLPLGTEKKIFEVAMTGCPDCGDGTKNPTAFSIEYDRPTQGQATADRLKAMGKTQYAIIESDDATGQDHTNAVKTATDAAGIKLVTTEKFTVGALDLSVQAKNLKDSGVDTVYLSSAVPSDIINILKAFTEVGFKPNLLGNAALGSNQILPAADADWVKKFAASGFSPNFLNPHISAQAQTFKQTFTTITGQSSPLQSVLNQSAVPQDAFDIIKAAIEATHSTDGPTLAKWLETNGFKGLRANYTFDSKKHNGFSAKDVGWVLPGSFNDGFSTEAPAA